MRHHHTAKAATRLTALFLLAATLLVGCGKSDKTTRIALVLSSASGHHWENIIDGAETAAQRMKVELRCYAPDEEEGIQMDDLIELALADHPDALVVASAGESDLMEELRPVVEDLPVVAVGVELPYPGAVSSVLNDDAKMGSSAAIALAGILELGDGVLLLTDSVEYDGTELREKSLRAGLNVMGAEISRRFFTGDNREWAYRQTLQQLYLDQSIDAVIAFSAQATVGAAQAVDYLGRDIAIIGTDIVPELIECIDEGSITATIVRNSFGMGYIGVEYAVNALAGEAPPEHQTLSSVVVNQDNLFTPEIEKMVFPYE